MKAPEALTPALVLLRPEILAHRPVLLLRVAAPVAFPAVEIPEVFRPVTQVTLHPEIPIALLPEIPILIFAATLSRLSKDPDFPVQAFPNRDPGAKAFPVPEVNLSRERCP